MKAKETACFPWDSKFCLNSAAAVGKCVQEMDGGRWVMAGGDSGSYFVVFYFRALC